MNSEGRLCTESILKSGSRFPGRIIRIEWVRKFRIPESGRSFFLILLVLIFKVVNRSIRNLNEIRAAGLKEMPVSFPGLPFSYSPMSDS